ncbi:hypothetical protein D3C80_1532290 [compost metagenome]
MPASPVMLACISWVGRLRIRLMVAEGLPMPLIKPVAPRTISMRSYIAMLCE